MGNDIANMPVLMGADTRETRRLCRFASQLEARIHGEEPKIVVGEPIDAPNGTEERPTFGIGTDADLLSGAQGRLCALEILSKRTLRRALAAIEEEIEFTLNGEAA